MTDYITTMYNTIISYLQYVSNHPERDSSIIFMTAFIAVTAFILASAFIAITLECIWFSLFLVLIISNLWNYQKNLKSQHIIPQDIKLIIKLAIRRVVTTRAGWREGIIAKLS